MPRRTDIETILVIGSGPIVIGQACEFDYSGSQACRVLSSEGYRVVLANSNPATIMTDPELADRTYVEPLDRGGARPPSSRRATGGDPPHSRRPDGPEPGDGARTQWAAGSAAGWSSSAPTQRRSPPPRIGTVSRGDGRDRSGGPGFGFRLLPGGGDGGRRGRGFSARSFGPSFILGGAGSGTAPISTPLPASWRRVSPPARCRGS